MTDVERIEATYQHSIIQYFSPEGGMYNTTLRERFKMHTRQAPQISKIIKETMEKGRIKQKDNDNKNSKKFVKYVPYRLSLLFNSIVENFYIWLYISQFLFNCIFAGG